MKLGILSDTHNELAHTQNAIWVLRDAGAEALFHCGDLASPPIVEACSVLPCWFVFGNHDADDVPALEEAAERFGVTCLGWSGVIELASKRIGIVNGHMRYDVRHVTARLQDYILFGHSHLASDEMRGSTRWINPGALHRADEYSVVILDLNTDERRHFSICDTTTS